MSSMRCYCYGLFRTEKAPKPDWPKCPQWGVTVAVYSGLRKPPNLTGQSVRNEPLLLQSIQDWESPQTWLAKVSAMRGYCYGLFRTEKAPKPDWPECPQWGVVVTVYSGLRNPPNLTGQSVRNERLLLQSIQDWESPQTWLAKVSPMSGCCYGLFRTEKSPKPDWPKCPQWGVAVTVYSGQKNGPNLTGLSVRNEGLLLRSIQDWDSPQTWLAKVSPMSGCCYGLFRTEKSPKPDWPKCPQWGVAATVYSGLRNPPNLTGQNVRNEGLLLRSIQNRKMAQTWLA